MAQWIIVGLAFCAIIFNTGLTYGHIHDLRKEVAEMKQEIKELWKWLREKN